eukprot:Plantae.Rhodophyta-Purpureofilum_apyrenoidigerum.ctg15073.p1 GENE.Plantae.Rhodophyta-Purpureofilum_apyrenoidigerum.ctg15073~~Plantae.Rhodophyta-Purpureofilum_apyrenoidigerum.ctg15073.p1  ORF type:complete len:282 (-),score=77.23 Plantae.Rhodophyta-Purpureofilum_apyrenoidigerum.ctg15073:170-1015(-)
MRVSRWINSAEKTSKMVYELVLIRHGESQWNKENRFCGWVDQPLSETGESEAKMAGKQLKKEGYTFDLAYTSVLKRAIKTLHIVLEEMDMQWIPEVKNWRLNERMYGALQGLNKADTAEKYGDEQVLIWRRSYDTPPPAATADHEFYPGKEAKYKDLSEEQIPKAECLKDTVERVLPFWSSDIAPSIKSGKKVVIAAHGNSLRALVKYLDDIPDDKILKLNIPTGVPLLYHLDENLKPIKLDGAAEYVSGKYLGDADAIAAAAAAVAAQGKAKKDKAPVAV